MKNDPFFKFAAAIILTGLLAAFASASFGPDQTAPATAPTVETATHVPAAGLTQATAVQPAGKPVS